MRLVHYRVERLLNPDGDDTHQLVYESISKNKQSGGYGMGIVMTGSFKECHEKKREIENENTKRISIEILGNTREDDNA